MNLLERLHPVYQDKLSKANLEYPHLIAKLSDELETTQLHYHSIVKSHVLGDF